MTIDIDAIRNRAARVRARTCEPATDHEAYELARDAQNLLAKVDVLTAALERALDAKYAALGEVGQLRVQLGRVEDQLTAANHHTEGLAADVRDMQKANTAYANENARLRSKLAEQEAETGAYLIWSHHHSAWWGPNAQGYRSQVGDAGRYALADTKKHLGRGCHCCLVPEVAVPAPQPNQTTTAAIRALIAHATDAEIDAGRINKYAHCGEVGTSFPNGTDPAYTEPCGLPNGHDEDHDWVQREAKAGVSR